LLLFYLGHAAAMFFGHGQQDIVELSFLGRHFIEYLYCWQIKFVCFLDASIGFFYLKFC